MPYEVAVVGSTGLVLRGKGGHVLSALQTISAVSNVNAIVRRPLNIPESFRKVHAIVEKESSLWATRLRSLQPVPDAFISSLGTTRAKAGGLENQRKIDYELNLELAKTAKDAGVKVYVLTSSSGANAASRFAYIKMRGELEEAVEDLGFSHTIILRPGLIVGDREESRPAEAVLRGIAKVAGNINTGWLKDFWAQDAEVIARAGVHAAVLALQGKGPAGKTWVVDQKTIVSLGRTTWEEFSKNP